ncbi:MULTISPECIES: hypothetical protein [Bacillus cereus group]|uniref:Uncharacterized protein n=3 Tax=Bacillus cereus group TaxID=86661 RepID=A0A9X6WIJ1_BACTU|nr:MULTISPECIES: hypothetical protein [Bacillus cereus group]PFJ30283.1 hypothetical protein COJ15_31245 [Bacillus thuringiensis]PGP12474.1 hypothetical protein COA01_32160 [Bacillus cereus]
MKILLYVSFVYMIVHLSKWAFKKGEKTRVNWEESISPQLEKTAFGRLNRSMYRMKISILSLFKEKYKLIQVELNKPYKDLFEEKLIDLMVEKRYVQEIREEINQILFYKEVTEYQRFNFEDSIQKSQRLQFFEIKETLSEVANKNLLRIVQKMYMQNMLMREEREIWKNILENNELLDSLGNDTGVDLVIQHETEQQRVIENEDKPVEIVTRTINTAETKRF